MQAFNVKGSKYTNSAGSNGSSTTAILFNGVEDLGGGMKALFQYEIDPSLADTSSKTAGTSATGTTSNVTSSIGNGQSFLGLETAAGTVKFGTPNLATLSASGDGNGGFSTAIGSGYRVTSFDAVRLQNSLRLDTPTFMGFSGSYVNSAKNNNIVGAPLDGYGAPATGNAQNQQLGRDAAREFGLAYANGPLTVRYADLKTNQWAGYYDKTASATDIQAATGAAFNLKTLSAKYDFANKASVSYFYQTAKSDDIILSGAVGSAGYDSSTQKYNRKTNGVAGSFMATPALKLMANYQRVKLGSDDAITLGSTIVPPASLVSPASGETTKVLGLGADYALSKRTTVYARYEKDTDNAIVRGITGFGTNAAGTYKATAFGLRHTF